jgi:hypothetical protein
MRPDCAFQGTSATVTYARTRIGTSDVQAAPVCGNGDYERRGWRGGTRSNSPCREYVADSVIRFAIVEPAPRGAGEEEVSAIGETRRCRFNLARVTLAS